ncbi:MAG: hypothetical protein ACI87E_002454 [Mariniblastus sp.]|jgi:hypothetical protein
MRIVILVVAFVCAAVGTLVNGSKLDADSPVDFKTQVVPVLTKLGCNAGACHGSATGRGGFKLSLFGSQPTEDHIAITQLDKGRRIHRFDASKSLILRKPGGEMEHGGQQLFELDSPAGKLLSGWIASGAKFNDATNLENFDVGPASVQITSPGQQHAFRFEATFSDGQTNDVTAWTSLTSNDPASVAVDDTTNQIVIKRRGRHILIARFLDQVVPIEILVPFYDSPKKQPNPSETFIDSLIAEKLSQLNIPNTAPANDVTFLRRLTLDLTGRIPTPVEVRAFIANESPTKRRAKIDALLASGGFVDFWTHKLATQLRIRSQANDKTGARVYHQWLKARLADHSSWQTIVESMLISSGDSHEIGPANFYRTTGGARLQAEFVSEAILGVKLRCANCHDHPLDHWTQDDYHGLAAIFATVKQTRRVTDFPGGENIHARTGKPARPRVPGEFFLDSSSKSRELLSKWMVGQQNPYFARAAVNRIWSSLMGRGLVDPVDDLRSTNPATHPKLLEQLANDFAEHDFDLRHTIRLICNSQTYQRSVDTSQSPEFHRRFYASAAVRKLSAEVLADSIGDVTGVYDRYPDHVAGTRAIQLFDSKTPSPALDILGRCSRETSCESDTQLAAGGLSTQLHLLNGNWINNKIVDSDNRLHRLLDLKTPTLEIVAEFYLRALGRLPNQSEQTTWERLLSSSPESNEGQTKKRFEDFLWSLLNSQEFTTNH